MVSIGGLPPSSVTSSQRAKQAQRVNKKAEATKSGASPKVMTQSVVAEHVTKNLTPMTEAELEQAQEHIQYDESLDSHSKKALEEYMKIKHQRQKEKLTYMMGVDFYI